MLSFLSNYYIVIGALFVVLMVSQAKEWSFMKKAVILSIFSLILLWAEKPPWFMEIVSQGKAWLGAVGGRLGIK